MKRYNRYICDKCHMELDPRETYAVSVDRIEPNDIYKQELEYHFCPMCLRLAHARLEQSTERF